MTFKEAFTSAVKSILSTMLRSNMVCEVIGVDKEKNTCTVKETGTDKEVNDVRLLSIEGTFAKQLAIYPKVGSLVLVSYIFLKSDECTVIKYSEVESLLLNGNEFGGLVKADVLIAELNKTNALVTAIAMALNTWVVAPTDGGLALKTIVTTALAGKAVGNFTNIKNDNVKHG